MTSFGNRRLHQRYLSAEFYKLSLSFFAFVIYRQSSGGRPYSLNRNIITAANPYRPIAPRHISLSGTLDRVTGMHSAGFPPVSKPFSELSISLWTQLRVQAPAILLSNSTPVGTRPRLSSDIPMDGDERMVPARGWRFIPLLHEMA